MKIHLAALALVALFAGCHEDHTHGTIALLVTDAPMPFEFVHSATVEIDRITIDEGPNSLNEPRVLYEGDPFAIELSSLRNGLVRHIFSRNVPVENYRRIHVHFSGAELVLSNGHRFSSLDGSLQMPAYGTQVFELTIEEPIHVTNGHWSRLLFDFDLPRSFSQASGENLLSAQVLQFQPLVHVVRPGLSGEIRGVVMQVDQQGQLAPVPDATLYFLPSGTEDLNLAEGATGTDADGSFDKIGLAPGTYDVIAQKGSQSVTHTACVVSASQYTLVDLSLP